MATPTNEAKALQCRLASPSTPKTQAFQHGGKTSPVAGRPVHGARPAAWHGKREVAAGAVAAGTSAVAVHGGSGGSIAARIATCTSLATGCVQQSGEWRRAPGHRLTTKSLRCSHSSAGTIGRVTADDRGQRWFWLCDSCGLLFSLEKPAGSAIKACQKASEHTLVARIHLPKLASTRRAARRAPQHRASGACCPRRAANHTCTGAVAVSSS